MTDAVTDAVADSGAAAGAVAMPQFPGAVGLTALEVYDWAADDGLHGGAPHVHLSCTECYVVASGHGSLQTLTRDGGLSSSELSPGDVVWFTPGTIHRSVNGDGSLRVVVVMENGGLPEAGDAVMTFPAEHLFDAEAYRAAASVLDADGRPSADRVLARRDLALAGFAQLTERTLAGDASALEEFYGAAARIVAPRLDEWRSRWEQGAQAAAELTGARLAALGSGDHSHLREAAVARIQQPSAQAFGMCGLLHAYDPVRVGLKK